MIGFSEGLRVRSTPHSAPSPLRFGETVKEKLQAYERWLPQHLAKMTPEDGRESLDIFRKVKTDVAHPPDFTSIKQPGQNLFVRQRKDGFVLRHDPRRGSEKPEGLFCNDMQHQNHFSLKPPANATVRLQATRKVEDPQTGAIGFDYRYHLENLPGVTVERQQRIDKSGRLTEALSFSNASADEVAFELEVGSEGSDLFQARFPDSTQVLTAVTREIRKDGDNRHVIEAYHRKLENPQDEGPRNVIRSTYEMLEAVNASPLKADGNSMLVTTVKIPPGQTAALKLALTTETSRFGPPKTMPLAYEKTWDSLATSIAVQSSRRGLSHVGKMWDTSFRDLRTLTIPVQCGAATFYPASAGIPNYVSLFGRDSIIAAMQTVQMNPLIARDTLAALAYHQGKDYDAFTEEEPGKILHEMRLGEVTRLQLTPHRKYYGTIDATPLFVMLFDAYFKRTPDPTLQRVLWPNFEAALSWIDNNVISKPGHPLEGFLTQRDSDEAPGSAIKLKNIGWKDSEAATRHVKGEDGKLKYAKYPLALAEVQAYVYGAWKGAEGLYAKRAEAEKNPILKARMRRKADDYARKAAELKRRFNEKFWLGNENFVAMALQADGKPLPSISSNGAQSLVSGIVDADKAARMAERLMAPDMLSGWGMRTLSAREYAYEPFSYHNGTIWPHDNSLVVSGLNRYGFKREAQKLATQLLEAGRRFPEARLPELYTGLPREKGDRTILVYPNTCSPQAWAAGTTPLLISSLLGMQVDEATKTVSFTKPKLPEGVNRMELSVGVVPVTVRRTPDLISEDRIRGIEQLNAQVRDESVLLAGERVTIRLERTKDGVRVTKTGGSDAVNVRVD